MSTHPNTVLVCRFTPQDLARKTMRDILAEFALPDPDDDVRIGSEKYHHKILEHSWLEGYQLGGEEGDLLFFDLVTYGYGEEIAWPKLVAQVAELEQWAKGICERHHCTHAIYVTANYW